MCTDVSLAHDGKYGQIQLAVHMADKEDLEISPPLSEVMKQVQ